MSEEITEEEVKTLTPAGILPSLSSPPSIEHVELLPLLRDSVRMISDIKDSGALRAIPPPTPAIVQAWKDRAFKTEDADIFILLSFFSKDWDDLIHSEQQ